MLFKNDNGLIENWATEEYFVFFKNCKIFIESIRLTLNHNDFNGIYSIFKEQNGFARNLQDVRGM